MIITEQILNNLTAVLFFCLSHGLKRGTYDHFHNILRLLDVLPNFPFTASETMRDYYV